MDKEYIKKRVKELYPWYQRINFDGLISTKGGPYSSVKSGESLWKTLSTLIPESLNGMNVLDLGCNAGYFSLMSAVYGANKVVGVELSKKFFSQTFFVKEYFEDKHKKNFDNVQFINKDISDVDFSKMGPFDYVYALAILYHIGKHKYGKMTPKAVNAQLLLIKNLSKITNNFIVRARKGKMRNSEYYTKIFNKHGFKLVKFIPEGKRDLILYSK